MTYSVVVCFTTALNEVFLLTFFCCLEEFDEIIYTR